jgi:hypothetical protein
LQMSVTILAQSSVDPPSFTLKKRRLSRMDLHCRSTMSFSILSLAPSTDFTDSRIVANHETVEPDNVCTKTHVQIVTSMIIYCG